MHRSLILATLTAALVVLSQSNCGTDSGKTKTGGATETAGSGGATTSAGTGGGAGSDTGGKDKDKKGGTGTEKKEPKPDTRKDL